MPKRDKLSEYKKKRNLKESGEPNNSNRVSKTQNKKLIFVVHFHRATHDHYDLRLEIDGVLKSWAVPKSPLEVNDGKTKRLAIQVEDHPLSYRDFKGTIPEGNYGAGEVKIWDHGVYELEKNSPKEIIFNLKGKKLRGEYILIKTSYGNKPLKSWLFFKKRD